MMINLLDLFSGIGGFAQGIKEAGFEVKNHYFSEVDKHAIANYQYNFKDAKYLGSVTDVSGWRIERPNIITFGSPCQDFSLAGKRKGMGGARSSLISYAIMAIERFRPDVFIWENVKGTYSSNNGEDFWAIMQAFANIDGYRCEQQLLNTSWFLPQNRERIYTIGHLAGRSEPGVFPIREAARLHKENYKVDKSRVANCLDANYGKGWLDHGQRTHIVVKSLTETRTEEAKEIRRNSQKEGRDFSPRRGKELTVRNDDNANTVTATQGFEQLICINELEKKYRFHKNDDRKSGMQGRDVFKEDCKLMDIIDNHPKNIIQGSSIRRLTEIECERLQGFPDNWTQYGNYDGVVKKVSKTQRYKMCGNAVSVPAVREIGLRLKKQMKP